MKIKGSARARDPLPHTKRRAIWLLLPWQALRRAS